MDKCSTAGILYGVKVIPITTTRIAALEAIQTKLGKAILKIPYSSANMIVYTELGWKPIKLLVAAAKLRFLKRVSDISFTGSPLVKACMLWNKNNKATL